MRRSMRLLLAALACLILVAPSFAEAGIVARINISSQRMDVYVDGRPRYTWLVSTARPGYRTPVGTFKPTGIFRYHASTIYSGSPMPYSIFFLRGYAIHGSYETKYLGRPASHGCVRLHPANAAVLYSLVKQYGTGNTLIQISY
jgi:lipoprotein-anchoring transpeptidase ErfK/SrfK